MISKQIIHDYISRIENEISDNNNTSNENNGVQYCGMLYGIRIAEGKKQYPINDTGIEITDEFKKGLIKGLRRVLWCTQKKEQLVKKRYEDADEALIASFFESECIPNCIERLKNKLRSANIDKGDTMRTKEDILIEISKIKHSINRGCSTSETTYKVGMVDGMYYAVGDIENDNTGLQDDNVVTVNIKYELDKAAYKQYVADMNKIEAEFKEGNRTRKFIAGEKLECGDMVYKKSDGKMYKAGGSIESETKHNTSLTEELEKVKPYKTLSKTKDEFKENTIPTGYDVVSTNYEGSMGELIRQLGYTVRATRDGKSLKFERIEHVDTEQKETIPATLKDVCGWWMKTYGCDVTLSKHTHLGHISKHIKQMSDERD